MAEIVRTTCPLDCWDACGMLAHVENGRVVRLEGDPDHPVARGALCARTYRYPERVESPERIVYPLLRGAAGFRRIGWDEALDLCCARLNRKRREGRTHSILHVQSAGSMGIVKDLSRRFFRLLGGVSVAEGDFCLGAGKDALKLHLGDYRPHSWRDLAANAGSVVLWGRDPFISGPHRAVNLKEARQRGAAIISVNPVVVGPRRLLDLHLPIRPGADLYLAALAARRLREAGKTDPAALASRAEGFEEFNRALDSIDIPAFERATGLDPESIERFCAMLVERAPAAILLGTGVIRHRLAIEAVGWIVGLAAALGVIGRPGGGVSFSVRHRRDADAAWLDPPEGGVDRPLSAGRWHQEILEGIEPAVDTLWVNGANPVAMLPDSSAVLRALETIPFRVVSDFHMTDTARNATLILPITSFLEEEGIVTSWGHEQVGRQRRVIAPSGEARTDLWILQQLAQRLGFGHAMEGDEMAWARRLLGPVLDQEDWNELENKGWTRNPIHEDVPYADGVFPREGGRCLLPSALPDAGFLLEREPDYPYIFLTPKSGAEHLSQVLSEREPEMYRGKVSSDVAAAIGAPGAFRIRSRNGEIPAHLAADPSLPPGVVVLPLSGSIRRGTAVNLLTEDRMAADGVTPAYYDTKVRLEPMA